MNEQTIERVAKHIARSVGGEMYSESDWPAFIPLAMDVIDIAEDQWQPIETAPKDGTYVIVFPPTASGRASSAYWNNDKYSTNPKPYWHRLDNFGKVSESRNKGPTSWRPIPKPPKN